MTNIPTLFRAVTTAVRESFFLETTIFVDYISDLAHVVTRSGLVMDADYTGKH